LWHVIPVDPQAGQTFLEVKVNSVVIGTVHHST
jgi:hypothetical protein